MKRREFIAAGMGLTLGGLSDARGALADVLNNVTNQKVRPTPLADFISNIKTNYDIVVIGSGYGASVMAARLANSSGNLCVLERGREWFPGDFPRTAYQLATNVRRNGNPLGLVDFSSPEGSDVDIIAGNGLGGTSLINAAIAIRPLQNVFLEKEWPQEIQSAALSGELDLFYDLAESVLKPEQLLSLKDQSKTKTHRQVTSEMGRKSDNLRLNIRPENFAAGALNENGVKQGPCIQCGDCCTGCNYGAKNTLTTNYLAIAKNKGAQIFTQCEVDKIEKTSSGYEIHVTYRGWRSVRKIKVKAKKVFLGAGAKGSTEILIQSQSDNLKFSEALGTRLSANGDVMGLAYNTQFKTNILALGSRPEFLSKTHQPGPIIASYADYRSPSLAGDVSSQFLLLDGVVPSALRHWIGEGLAAYASKSAIYFDAAQLQRMRHDQEFGSSEEGALNHSLLFFACGHDSSGGRFVYSGNDRKSIKYVWKNALQESTFERIHGVMKKQTERMGGVFIPNPRATILGQKLQATHPLGGCPMGQDSRSGVVDHLGRVFDTNGKFHENLYVVDASIIPRSLAATPLLTITALAERIAAHLQKK